MKYLISFLIGAAFLLVAHYWLSALLSFFVAAAFIAGAVTLGAVEYDVPLVWALIVAVVCGVMLWFLHLPALAVATLWVLATAMLAKIVAVWVIGLLPPTPRPSH